MRKITTAFIIMASFLMADSMTNDKVFTEKTNTGFDSYVGLITSVNETTARDSDSDYFGISSGEFTNAGVGINAGYKVHETENIDIFLEARLGSSVWMEDTENVKTTSAAIYIKPMYRVIKALDIYAMLGGAYVNFEGENYDNSGTGVSGGFGIQLNTADHVSLFTDIIWSPAAVEIDNFNQEANYANWNAGILYRF